MTRSRSDLTGQYRSEYPPSQSRCTPRQCKASRHGPTSRRARGVRARVVKVLPQQLHWVADLEAWSNPDMPSGGGPGLADHGCQSPTICASPEVRPVLHARSPRAPAPPAVRSHGLIIWAHQSPHGLVYGTAGHPHGWAMVQLAVHSCLWWFMLPVDAPGRTRVVVPETWPGEANAMSCGTRNRPGCSALHAAATSWPVPPRSLPPPYSPGLHTSR